MYLLAQHPADEKVQDRTQGHFCIPSTEVIICRQHGEGGIKYKGEGDNM